MSGTSADGINVALVRVSDAPKKASEPLADAGGRAPAGHSKARPRHAELKFQVLAHAEYPYPKAVRRAVLAAMNAPRTSVAELSRLNFLLGELYAEAVLATQRRFHLNAELVGCHGQTLYHQGEPTNFLGRKIATTWQTGEGAVIAARTGVTVVSDFRPADMAAGGKGAPLVPFLDYLLYRNDRVGRIVQNIGGIANLTAIPAAASPRQVVAFDTGPGNMVIDAVTERLFGKPYDRDGRIAASGTVIARVVAAVLRGAYFRRKPPKTAGREQFGREFVREFIRLCGRADKRDVVATATALTARSIAEAVQRFLVQGRGRYAEFIVSGGGTKNATLMSLLPAELLPLSLQIRSSDEFGLPREAKEAAAFALLAYQTWNRRPSNVPSATGAKRAAVLGKISYP
jgi:anhydro-N-acetylmuramic acid kinase